MKEITKILSDEHKNILIVVEALSNKCKKLSKEEIDREFFGDVIDFIKNYADKYHHAKEEDILFREFCREAEGGKVHCNPVEQMLYEHNLGREFVKQIEKGLKDSNKSEISEGAERYSQLIQEHIFKEDNILYPMTEEYLDENIQKKMLDEFKKIEQKRKKEIEKYLNFVRSLR